MPTGIEFQERFENINWTGQGLYNPTTIDRIPTIELRSRCRLCLAIPHNASET